MTPGRFLCGRARSSPLLAKLSPRRHRGALRKRYGSTVSASQAAPGARGTVRGDPDPGRKSSIWIPFPPASAEDADARTAAVHGIRPPPGRGPTPSSDPRATSRCLIPTRPVRRPTAGVPRPRPPAARVACRGPAPDRCGAAPRNQARPPGGAAPATTWRRGSLCRPGRQPPQPHRAPSVPARRATSHAMDERADAAAAPRTAAPLLFRKSHRRRAW